MNGDTVLSLSVDCDFLYISMIKLLCLSNAWYHFGYQLIIPYYFPIVENKRHGSGCILAFDINIECFRFVQCCVVLIHPRYR